MSEGDLKREIQQANQKFKEWLAEHPTGKFSDFYVQQAIQSIDENLPHPSLGENLDSGERWREAGLKQLAFLKGEGLQPEHTVVDYGCGSLRVGQHLIQYLAPEHYWGLDITDVFTQMGLDLLPAELISEKKPNFRVIEPSACLEARSADPDFVYCRAVLRHVPPSDIAEFFEGLISTVAEKTLLVVTGVCAEQSLRIGTNSWAHSQNTLRQCIEQHGARVQFELKSKVATTNEAFEPARTMAMRIRLA